MRLTARKPKNPGYPETPQTLGDHIRKRRLDLGLLQRDVAARIGVTEATVWQWERNRTEPEARLIPQVHGFLQYCPWKPIRGFQAILQRYRVAAGLSQEELAAKARIDESTIAKWERGDTIPLEASLRRLARFFEKIGQPLPAVDQEDLYSRNRRIEAARRSWYSKRSSRSATGRS